MMKPIVRLLGLALLLGLLSACQSTYYSAMEQVGIHKRDILVDRVEDARDAQQEAQVAFKDALEQFRSVVQFDGGDLDRLYSRMQGEYDDAAAAAANVRERIEKVDRVSGDLFDEWQEELTQYSNRKLRDQSARQLRETRQRYRSLLQSLKRAEQRMQPVLTTLHDNVLFLKHNLNAQAVGSLRGEFDGIRQEIELLVRDMQRAIRESDAFIQQLAAG